MNLYWVHEINCNCARGDHELVLFENEPLDDVFLSRAKAEAECARRNDERRERMRPYHERSEAERAEWIEDNNALIRAGRRPPPESVFVPRDFEPPADEYHVVTILGVQT